MKYIYLIVIIILELLIVKIFKLIGNFNALLIIDFMIFLSGILFSFYAEKKANKKLKDLGWGLLHGSLYIVLIGAIIMLFLSFCF